MSALSLLFAAATAQATAEHCPPELICGQVVTDAQVGLGGARITSDNGTNVITDAEGRFRVNRPERSDAYLVISADGYEAITIGPADLAAIDNVIALALADSAAEDTGANDIVVTARRQSLPFTRQVIDQMTLLTDPAANADALLAVAGLPSSTNLDNSADVQLRGGAVGLSRVYYNDIPLYEVVRGSSADQVTRVASIFNANLIRSVETYPTLPPTYLANSAAGAIRILPSVDAGAPSSLYVGLPGFTLTVAGEAPGGGAFTAYASGIDLSASLALNPKLEATTTSFRSGALGGAATYDFDDGSELNLLTVLDLERGRFPLRILNQSGTSTNRRSRLYSVGSFEAPVGNVRVKLDGALTFTENRLEYLAVETRSQNRYVYANADVAGDVLDGAIDYRGGVSFEDFRLVSSGTLDFASGVPTVGQRTDASRYAALHLFVTARPITGLALAFGTRQFIVGDLDLAPAYSVAATFGSSDGQHRLIIGAGTFSAAVPPELGSITGIGVARSRQASADYELRLDAVSVRAGLYTKTDDFMGARTRIEGADASVQVQISQTSQISASFARSRQSSDGFRADRDLGYAVRVQARVGIGTGASVNATYTLRSGAPYTRITGGGDDGAGGYFPIFDSARNAQQLRPFRSLDINIVSPLPIGRPGSQPIGFVSVTNVFDRRNEARAVYNRDFSAESRVFYDRRAISFGFVQQF